MFLIPSTLFQREPNWQWQGFRTGGDDPDWSSESMCVSLNYWSLIELQISLSLDPSINTKIKEIKWDQNDLTR